MTSARPPVFENGKPSEATNRILIFSCLFLVRYPGSGDSISLAQLRALRKSDMSKTQYAADFSMGTARHRKTHSRKRTSRAHRLEAFSQSPDGGFAAGRFSIRQQRIYRTARADMALGVRVSSQKPRGGIDLH